ncbi:MAG TPA: sugar phosphate isomerase/epimerase [Sedimentisphaerales bacterium]|nr:sugar phosphate isomerase/epimerase [Sedimentisphaerales bacterium]
MKQQQSRRQFLKAASIGAAASLAGPATCLGQNHPAAGEEQERSKRGASRRFELGLASYTLRKFNLEQTLAMTQRVGLKYICLKSFHLPLDSTVSQIHKAAAKVKGAGLQLYGGGVIYMKTEAEVNRAFDYARDAGMTTIVGVPAHELLPLVNAKVRKYDIAVAIHNHGPGDKLYPTPGSVYERIKGLDRRIGLCIDVGHTQRAGVDPAEAAQKFADRLLDVHMKDVSAPTAEGQTVEMGRGVIDVPRFLRTLLEIGYAGILAFEYEKDAQDPLPGLAESVGYVRGVLAAV